MSSCVRSAAYESPERSLVIASPLPHSLGMNQRFTGIVLTSLIATYAAGCGSNEDSAKADGCSVSEQTGCSASTVCENVTGGEPACFAPVVVRGRVVQAANATTGIANSVVALRDINGELMSRGVDTTDGDGRYELVIPTARAADGSPSLPEATLRADAAGFATFPSGLRVALPIDGTAPVMKDGKWVIENASTDAALDRLPKTDGLGTVRGFVRAADAGGALIVAGAASALCARDGSFTLFNVSSGSVELRGYKAGLKLAPAQASVEAGKTLEGVELFGSTEPLGTVAGSVSFVNAGAQETSVVLVVQSTFNAALARGEVPVGLRQFPVGGTYSFSGVPAGDYVVLAAFENDDLVRDPDTAIGGTAIQTLSVGSQAVSVDGFKITGALQVISPGADGPQPVVGAPTFHWMDDSSEDGYEVTVYDTFGNAVFSDPDVPRVTGSADVSLTYGGPTLTPGYYQFRAVSWRAGKGTGTPRTYISATEDLKGVFVVE